MKDAQPHHTVKELALARAEPSVRPLFERVLRSYEQYAEDMQTGTGRWQAFVDRNVRRIRFAPIPRSSDSICSWTIPAYVCRFSSSGAVDEEATGLILNVREQFEKETGIDLRMMFNKNRAGSLQSIRSFGQYSARVMQEYLHARPDLASTPFGAVLTEMKASEGTIARFSDVLKAEDLSAGGR